MGDERLQESGTNKDCNYEPTRLRLREIAEPMLIQVTFLGYLVEITKKTTTSKQHFFFFVKITRCEKG